MQDTYEPGSIIKPIIMAAGLDAQEITADTSFHDEGPIELDEYKVTNHDNKYRGWITMTKILEDSLNTGMTFIAQRLGKRLMYKYLQDFGFGKRTDVGLDVESPGSLSHFRTWADITHANISFGQGIAATPMQMITAFTALANGGKLLQPHIIKELRYRDRDTKNIETKVVSQVISEEVSRTITSMLISVVEHGGGAYARIPGYYVAGKTGTAQIPDQFGRYESGIGTTIASFMGYAPANDPKFTTIVRVIRPRSTQW